MSNMFLSVQKKKMWKMSRVLSPGFQNLAFKLREIKPTRIMLLKPFLKAQELGGFMTI